MPPFPNDEHQGKLTFHHFSTGDISMKPHVKICGIRRSEDAFLAENLGASAIGFAFYHKSERYIEPADARKISDRLGPFIARIGVFVDEDPVTIRRIAESVPLTAVQLHGSETPDYCSRFRWTPVIKAFRVGADFDASELGRYSASAYLFDTLSRDAYGGTGQPFDWRLTRDSHLYWRIILAGGLSPENIRDAIETVRPWAVDVSSGVEARPGVKDHDKMQRFFEELNR